MKKIKKILFLLLFTLFIPIVSAGSFTVSSSSTNPTVGSSITITVNGSNLAGKFTVSSSNTSVLSGGGSIWVEDGSNSVTFKANSAGNSVVTITPSDVSDSTDGSAITGSKTITINVKDKTTNTNSNGNTNTNNNTNTTTNTVKSSINYLSKLAIEGVELSPAFDKNTTEYEVVLESGINLINVIAEKESSTSYVTGAGGISVSEGINFINVVVTAENGAKKTYIIKATVLEEEPIIINTNEQDMTLIRKSEAMPKSSDYYVLGSVIIDDVEVPAYVSDITGYTLVALKDSNGNVFLYRYDKETNSYLDYKEFGFNALRISILEAPNVPDGYVIDKITINEEAVTAYTKEGSYPLIYGMNIENGETSFYSYDSHENTLQRYEVVNSKDNLTNYYYVILGLLGFIIFQFIMMIMIIASKNKKQRKILRDKLDSKTEFEQSISNTENKVEEENIEDKKEKSKKKKKEKKKKITDDMENL